jgi:hypothetical protein
VDSYFLAIFSVALMFLLPSLNTVFSAKFFLLLIMVAWARPRLCRGQQAYS